MGSLEDCRRQINRELRYQSSMDLDEDTYAAIRCATFCSLAGCKDHLTQGPPDTCSELDKHFTGLANCQRVIV